MLRFLRGAVIAGAVALAIPGIAAAATPTAALTVTQYSGLLKGNLGEAVSGVTVTASLERNVAGTTTAVATGTGTTNAQGQWSATLVSLAKGTGDTYGVPGDAISLSYSGPSGTTLPANGTFGGPGYLGPDTTISADGSQFTTSAVNGSCTGIDYLVDATTVAASPAASWCSGTPASAVTNATNVWVQYTSTVSDPSSTATITMTTLSRAGLVGVGGGGSRFVGGAPTCQADLVTTVITCTLLDDAQYTLTSSTGTAYPLTMTRLYSYPVDYQGTAAIPGLVSGQVFTLTRAGLSRPLSHFAVPAIVDHIALDGTESGTCKPFKLIVSQNVVCGQAGTFSGLSGPLTIEDEASGATATATIPTLSDLIPTQDASVPAADFFAYATLNGTGDAAQVVREFKAIRFSVITHNGAQTVFTGGMHVTDDPTAPYESVEVKNIPAGLYYGQWTMVDRNGDTRVYRNLFAAQPPAVRAKITSPAAYRGRLSELR